MTLDNVVCPHCGYSSEDDELCAACGQFKHDDNVAVRDVSILGLLGSGLRSLLDKRKHYTFEEEDLDFDPNWSALSCNIYNHKRYK